MTILVKTETTAKAVIVKKTSLFKISSSYPETGRKSLVFHYMVKTNITKRTEKRNKYRHKLTQIRKNYARAS